MKRVRAVGGFVVIVCFKRLGTMVTWIKGGVRVGLRSLAVGGAHRNGREDSLGFLSGCLSFHRLVRVTRNEVYCPVQSGGSAFILCPSE
jgi:hypothetical protein